MLSLPRFWTNLNQWVQKIPNRALESAYQGAVVIKTIEDQHFEGRMISTETEGGQSVYGYYKSALDRELAKINLNLAQLRITHFFALGKALPATPIDTEIREKLNFIESVIGKYRQAHEEKLVALEQSPKSQLLLTQSSPAISTETPLENPPNFLGNLENRLGDKFSGKRGRLSEKYEQEVIQEFRKLREKRKIAWRMLALLIIIPLVVQVATKNLIYAPILARVKVDSVQFEQVKILDEIREKSLEEYRNFRDALEIKQLLDPKGYSEAEKREKLKDKSQELFLEAGYKSQEGLANILADLTALLSFGAIVYFRQRQSKIVMSFLSDSFLGLNVITQVFLFILLTDMFVGFHSAEGWDVILSKTFSHLGLSENPAFIGLFIATIPVMLDSLFKLLIFNYFTRRSPTAVAILEKMNQ